MVPTKCCQQMGHRLDTATPNQGQELMPSAAELESKDQPQHPDKDAIDFGWFEQTVPLRVLVSSKT